MLAHVYHSIMSIYNMLISNTSISYSDMLLYYNLYVYFISYFISYFIFYIVVICCYSYISIVIVERI